MQGIRSPYSDPEVDKAAFMAWHQEGTILRACQKLKEDGVKNTRGRSFSADGVRKAAVRYMINHFPEAKVSFQKAYERFGYSVKEENIERLLIKMAVAQYKNPYRIKHWLIQNNLLDKHKVFIESLVAL